MTHDRPVAMTFDEKNLSEAGAAEKQVNLSADPRLDKIREDPRVARRKGDETIRLRIRRKRDYPGLPS